MADEAKASTARRDLLQAIEIDVQKKWDELKIFEQDAGGEGEEKFFATFPYPYMNGPLHIGHAFTLTKAMFATQFQRLCGKKALFPFGFHCTGMPMQAAANKLKREYETYGTPYPTFPAGRPIPKEVNKAIEIDDEGVTLVWKAPASTGLKAGVDNIEAYHLYMKVGDGDFKKVKEVKHPDAQTLKAQEKKVSCKAPVEGGKACVYKVRTLLKGGKFTPDSNVSDEVSVDAAPKQDKKGGPGGGKRVAKKIQAKTGDAATQWEILMSMGMFTADDLLKFTDSTHWLLYWPPYGIRALKRFGAPIDWRRSFITTSVNPYYDKFIRWQFRKLKSAEKIGFGKRPTMYSPLDGQACMDHDRADGEGVGPQEYTGIKLKLLELPAPMSSLKGKDVYLVAATLRPETMCGQTNCWVLPEGEYGCFKASGNDVYVCSERAARNMSYQEVFTSDLKLWGKTELLCKVMGKDLMGLKCEAPTSPYKYVHLLPLLTIKMDKGTGIVTSVPSDSPDDYAAFMDLMNEGKRKHHGVKAEWVEPFKLIPIIDVEIDGEIRNMAAEYMCEKLGVKSQKDTEKLKEAHDVCYKLGFDKGVMTAGDAKGKPVKEAKLLLRSSMVKNKQCFIYSEPEKKVTSRSGDECVVAGIDQWYLKYGEEKWKKQIEDHINSDRWMSYNDRIKDSFMDAIGWLKEWACSRSFGLGTQVPWDEQFVIESLSDSTIYMAYYTICHYLQQTKKGEEDGSNLDGSKGSPAGIKPEDLSDEVLDYIFMNGKAPKSNIKKEVLDKMRKEFRFWYPLDLRVSGKDLIQNHLTMSLYNHSCVWEKEPEMWPKGFFCNGWLMVNNEKMSKSKGNFLMINETIEKYSADTVRLACANAGDTLEDANLEEKVADKSLLDMPVFLNTMKSFLEEKEPMSTGKEDARFVDRWFANEMNRLVDETYKHYQAMYFREALRTCYHEFVGAFATYRDVCRTAGPPNKTLVMRYYEWQMIILSPICPHICEHGWSLLKKPGSVIDSRWPKIAKPADTSVSAQGIYMYDSVKNDFIKLKEKVGTPDRAVVYVALKFPDWKVKVLNMMKAKKAKGELTLCTQEQLKEDPKADEQWKAMIKELMQDAELKKYGKHVGPFAAFKRDEGAGPVGDRALDAKVPFDELSLVKEHQKYLEDKLRLPGAVTVRASEDLEDPSQADAASNAQPGKPAVFYGVPAGAAKAKAAPKAKAGGGGGNAAPAKNGKAAAAAPKGSTAVITDLKALNEHLSSRSYFAGGCAPSAADRDQLAAMKPGAVSAEQFPHVDRWQRHISHFSPAARDRW